MTADEKIEHLLKEKNAKEVLEHCLEIYGKIKRFKTPSPMIMSIKKLKMHNDSIMIRYCDFQNNHRELDLMICPVILLTALQDYYKNRINEIIND